MILFRRNGPLPSFSLALSFLSLKSSSTFAEDDSTLFPDCDGPLHQNLIHYAVGRRSQETYELSRCFFLPDNFMDDIDSDLETEFDDLDGQLSSQTVFDGQPPKNRLLSLQHFLSALLRKWSPSRGQKYRDNDVDSHTAKSLSNAHPKSLT